MDPATPRCDHAPISLGSPTGPDRTLHQVDPSFVAWAYLMTGVAVAHSLFMTATLFLWLPPWLALVGASSIVSAGTVFLLEVWRGVPLPSPRRPTGFICRWR